MLAVFMPVVSMPAVPMFTGSMLAVSTLAVSTAHAQRRSLCVVGPPSCEARLGASVASERHGARLGASGL
eukprot:6936293-Alexandrium_andersonii.AAC.1